MFWYVKKKKEKEESSSGINYSSLTNESETGKNQNAEEATEKNEEYKQPYIVDSSAERRFEIIYQATEVHTDKTMAD